MRRGHLSRSALLINQHFGVNAPIAGFVDAKIWVICKPGLGETSVYNGKDRVHGLKWQSVIDCFGLLCHFYGGRSARRHDAFLFDQSGVYEMLDANLQGLLLGIFGDLAYPASDRLLKPYAGNLTPDRLEFNRWYSLQRVVVEWGFGKLVALFPFVDYHKKLKILLSPVTPLVDIAAFFTNCHTLLYGGQIAQYFGCVNEIPSLTEYFN